MTTVRKINVSQVEGNNDGVLPAGTIVAYENDGGGYTLRVHNGVTEGGVSLNAGQTPVIFNGSDGIVVGNLNNGIAALFNNGDVYITGGESLRFTGLDTIEGESSAVLRFWNGEGRHSSGNDTTELVTLNVGNDADAGDPTLGFFKIITEKQVGGEKEWKFDADGNLTLPTGGDILDSEGNSVLGGTSGDQNVWVQTFETQDGAPDDIPILANSVEYDSEGNVIALFVHSAAGGSYYSVGKFTSTGVKIWTARFADSFDTDGWGLAVDNDSNSIYVAGKSEAEGGQNNATLTKIDGSDGSIVWSKVYDFGFDSDSPVVDVASDGNPVMVGYASNGADEYVTTTKISALDGSITWTRSLDGQGDEKAYGMAVGPDGEVVAIGYMDQLGEEGDTDDHMLVVKYNSAGAIQWQKAIQFDAEFDCYGADADIDSDGNIYVTGNYQYYDSDNDTNTSALSILKLDSTGAKQWSRRVVGNCETFGTSVVVGPDDKLYLSGVTGNNNNSDFTWVAAKYGFDGAVEWQRLIDNTDTWTFGGFFFFEAGSGSNIAVKQDYVVLGGGFGFLPSEPPHAAVVQVSANGDTFSVGDWDFRAASFSGILNDTASDITVVNAGKTDTDNSENITTTTAELDTEVSGFLIGTLYRAVGDSSNELITITGDQVGEILTLAQNANGQTPGIDNTTQVDYIPTSILNDNDWIGSGTNDSNTYATITFNNGDTRLIDGWNTDSFGDSGFLSLDTAVTLTGEQVWPIVITSYNYSATVTPGKGISVEGNVWKFDNIGDLTLPSGGTISEGVVTDNPTIQLTPASPEVATQKLVIKGGMFEEPADYHLHLTTGDLSETSIFLGTDEHNVRTTIEGNIQITTPSEGNNVWEFGTDGNLTLPTVGSLIGNLIVPGSITSSGASPAPTLSGFSSVSALQFTNGNSNVTVNANSNLWTFDSTGNLTIPGSSGGFIKTVANASIGIVAVDNGTNNPAQLLSMTTAGAATSIISAYATNATIQTNATGTINTWQFDSAGNLTLPGNAIAINFANGTPAFGNIVSVNLDGNASNVLLGNGVFASIPSPGELTANLDANTYSIANLGAIDFDTAANISVGQGQMAWNSSDGTLDIGLGYSNVVLQVGQETHYVVRNDSGNTILNGTAVYCSGVTTGSGRVEASPMTGSTDPVKFLGLATQNITDGVNGVVTYFGYVRGLDTRGTANTAISVGDETWAVGDQLYVHPTADGKLTNVEPEAPNVKICVASIMTRNETSGTVFVRPTSNLDLVDHSDVQIDTPANGEVLQYVSANSRWENTSISSIANGNSNVSIASSNGNVVINAVGNTTMTVTGTGANVTGTLTSTGKIGYASGSTVTQTTNRGNGVTINALAGTIITTSASMVANQIDTFSVANDQVDPNNDIVLVQIVSPNFGVYNCIAQPSATISVSLTGFYINIVNISGFTTTSDAVTIRFMVIKAPNA
jgi:hypothetical protein